MAGGEIPGDCGKNRGRQGLFISPGVRHARHDGVRASTTGNPALTAQRQAPTGAGARARQITLARPGARLPRVSTVGVRNSCRIHSASASIRGAGTPARRLASRQATQGKYGGQRFAATDAHDSPPLDHIDGPVTRAGAIACVHCRAECDSPPRSGELTGRGMPADRSGAGIRREPPLFVLTGGDRTTRLDDHDRRIVMSDPGGRKRDCRP